MGIEETDWRTKDGHPASRTCYQVAYADREEVARVTVAGREVVSPTMDTWSAWQQYTTRVQRWITEHVAD